MKVFTLKGNCYIKPCYKVYSQAYRNQRFSLSKSGNLSCWKWGDATISAFFSPSEAKNGFVWGAGPVFLVPTATDELLGGKKWGIGPSALALLQRHSMTIGALVSQTWSVAGDEDRSDVNFLFMQPFFNYNWKSGAGLGIMGEITQNWEAGSTTAYIIPTVSGVTRIGKQLVSLLIGPRIQVASPNGNGAVFGVRAQLILVFPK